MSVSFIELNLEITIVGMGAPSVLKVLVMAGNDPLSVQRFNSLLKKSFES